MGARGDTPVYDTSAIERFWNRTQSKMLAWLSPRLQWYVSGGTLTVIKTTVAVIGE